MKKAVFLFMFALCLLTAVLAQAEGEWLWERRTDGTAVITGYTGENARELTVPETIDGTPVTALGERALAGVADLRTVTLPRRIAAIGEEALGTGVALRGWSGSFAQAWAAENSRSFSTLGFYQFFPGVADLTGSGPILSGTELTLDTADAAGLRKGNSVVFASPADLSALQAFTITGIRAEGGRTVLAVSPMEPLSAVESYRLEWHDVSLGDDSQARGASRGMSSVPKNGESESSIEYSAKGRKVTVTHSRKTRVEGYYEYKFNRRNEGYIQVITEETVTQKTQGMTSNKDISKDLRNFIKAMNPESGGFDLLHTGLENTDKWKDFATLSGNSSVKLSAAAVGTTKYTVRTTQVVHILGDDVSVIREIVDEDKNPVMEMSGYIKLDIGASVDLDLKLGSSLSIGSNGSLTLRVEEAPQYDSAVKCYDARVEYSYGFGVSGRLGLTTPENAAAGSAGITFKSIDLPIGPEMKMGPEDPLFHLEIRDNPDGDLPSVEKMRWCSVLPKDQYVIHFHTGTHTRIESVYGKAGAVISEPEKKPHANSQALKFLNWSTDPLENKPFDFSQPLPEIDAQEAAGKDGPNELDLWAMWSSPYRELSIDLNYDNLEPVKIHLLPGEYVAAEDRPAVPLRRHYRFLDWTAVGLNDNGIPLSFEWDFLGDPMPDLDITVIANWSDYLEDYDPVADAEKVLEEDEDLRNRMMQEFKIRSFISTEMQGMGAYSVYNNWRVLNYNLAGITGYSGDASVVVIPETFNGTPVVYLSGKGWENKASLRALIVPSTVCYITGFSDFPNLQYVRFSDDQRTFQGPLNTDLHFVGVETIPDNCFKNCTSLEEVVWPRNLHSIGSGAFYGTALTTAPLAMTSCSGIGSSAFESCSRLTTVTLPPMVDRLNRMVFAYCNKLNSINLDNILAYDYGCLALTGFETLHLPRAAKLADDFVTGCRNLKRLSITFHPNSNDTNGASVHHLSELESIELTGCALEVTEAPKLKTYSIDSYIYNGDRSDVDGYGLLKGLPSLSLLEIRNSSLFHLTARDCEALQTIDLTGTEICWPDYGQNFTGYDHRHINLINLPKLTRLIYTADNGSWTDVYLENVGLTEMDMSDWFLGGFAAWDCPALKSVRLSELPTAITVKPTVTLENTGLEEFSLPTGQQTITLYADNNPLLKTILLPNGLTTLDGSFHDNPQLTRVRLPENSEIILKKGFFSGCGNLRELTIPACWTASQLKTEILDGSFVSCLKVAGSADVSNIKPVGELFVAETTEGSAAWNALLAKGFHMRPAGEAWRAIRFEYSVPRVSYYDYAITLRPGFFDHPNRIEDGLLRVTPGESVFMPAVVLDSSYMITGYSAGGRPLNDPMTAPAADLTVHARCAKVPETTWELTPGGARLTGVKVTSGQSILILPETVGGYNVVEIDPAVYTAGKFTEIWLPSTLLRVSGEDFAECAALQKLHGAGKNWAADEDGLLYRTDDGHHAVGLILCPQGYEGSLTLPAAVKTVETSAIRDVAGLTGLYGAGLSVLDSQAVTGYNAITQLSFTDALVQIGANNFRGSPLETVTFAGDPELSDAAFVPSSAIRFFGPENAVNLTAWADRNSQKFNLYSLTLITDGGEALLELRAGTPLADFDPIDKDGSVFLGWAEQPVPELPVFVTAMPARDVRLEAVWQELEEDGAPQPSAGEEEDPLAALFAAEELPDGSLVLTRYRGSSSRPAIPREIGGKTVSAIGDYAFAGNTTVAAITLPDSITSVGAHAFDTAVALTQIEFRADEVALGEGALANCDSLRTVTLPAAQTSLPDQLFAGSESLVNVGIPKTVTTIGEEAFAYCTDLYTLNLPAGLRSFSAGMVRGTPLRSITVSASSTTLSGDGAALWTADGQTLLYVCPGARGVRLPSDVTAIAPEALRNCTALREVELPEKLRSIGAYAFENAGLRNLSVPSCLQAIGDCAFRGCLSLDTVYIPDTVTEIGLDIFGNEDVLIYADSTEGEPYRVLSGKYRVLVQAERIPVTGISFPETEISLVIGETMQLRPVFSPEGAQEPRLHWSLGTSNRYDEADVVSVDGNGLVTGIAVGTQKVYVQTPSGLSAEATFSVSYNTQPEPVVLTDVILTPRSGTAGAYYGTFDGIAYLAADARGDMTAKMGSENWTVSGSWFDISCPEYPGLFKVGDSYSGSYSVGTLPDGLDVADCTMVVVGTGERSLGFRKEFRCRVYRETVDIRYRISLPESLSLFVGDSVKVEGYTEGLFDLLFCRDLGYAFTSTNSEVAMVDASGRIQAKKPGTATIRISGPVRKGTCVILVRENKTELQAALSSERILKGKPEQITASAADPAVTFRFASSDESVVTVDESGSVVFRDSGIAFVSLKAFRDGQIVAGRTWQVEALIPYTDWTGEPAQREIPGIGQAVTLNVGNTIQLTNYATGSGSGYYSYPDPSTIRWESSDRSILRIDERGNALALKPGVATVRGILEWNGQAIEFKVCCDTWFTDIKWFFEDILSLAVGEEKPLGFLLSADGEGLSIEYSTEYGRATVDENGILAGVQPGDDYVTVTVRNRYGCEIAGSEIYFHVLASDQCSAIDGLPEKAELLAGETLILAPDGALKPAGATIGPEDQLSTDDETVAKIAFSDGCLVLSGLKPGATTVRISLRYGQDYRIPVIVRQPAVYGVLTNAPVLLLPGDSIRLTAGEVTPAGAAVTWSGSDASVLKVSADGTVTGIKAGIATVTMTVKDAAAGRTFTQQADIRVAAALSGFRTGSYMIATYNYGEYYLVLNAASASDDPADLVRRTQVESAQGYRYEVAYGDPNEWDDEDETVLYLVYEGYPDRYDRVTLVTDNGTASLRTAFDLGFEGDDTLSLAETVRLSVGQTWDPINAISNYTFTLKPAWTAENTAILRQNADGTFTALAAGETILTAVAQNTDGTTQSAQTTVKISADALTLLKLSDGENESVTLNVGDWDYLSFRFAPATAYLRAETEDPGLITCTLSQQDEYDDEEETEGYGSLQIRALKPGTTRITLRGAAGETLVIPVTVRPTLSFETNLINQSSLPVGSRLSILVICKPADPEAEISFTSSDPSAFTVDETGLLTAMAEGSSRITVTVNGLTRNYVLYAIETLRITAVTPGQAKLKPGRPLSLKALDENAEPISNDRILWYTSDRNVATVSADGVVKAVGGGTATITAADRSGLSSASMSVTVTDASQHTLLLPESLTRIEPEAFAGTTGIQSVTLGMKVAFVGDRAFAGCTGLEEVYILNDHCEVSPSAFADCGADLVICCSRDSDVWNACIAAGLTVLPR